MWGVCYSRKRLHPMRVFGFVFGFTEQNLVDTFRVSKRKVIINNNRVVVNFGTRGNKRRVNDVVFKVSLQFVQDGQPRVHFEQLVTVLVCKRGLRRSNVPTNSRVQPRRGTTL
jgi:hypothetical protein